MKRIPIQNNNSNNGKKLSAGEEVEADKITEEIRQYTSKQNPFATPSLRNCGDANTFTENIKRALEESTEDQEEVPVGNYFDAKTYNQKNMKLNKDINSINLTLGNSKQLVLMAQK